MKKLLMALVLGLAVGLSATGMGIRPAEARCELIMESDFGPVLEPHCGPSAGAIGAIVAAAGRASRANLARARAACTPITATNAASVVIAGSTNIGFGQRVRWAPGSDAYYTLGNTEVDRFDLPGLQKTVLQSGGGRVLDFNPASGLVALASNQVSVQLRDLRTQTDRGTISASGQFGSAWLSPDGSLIAFSLLSAIAVEVRSTANGALQGTFTGFQTGSPVYAASFAPEGQSLIWLARARVQEMALAGGAFRPALEHEDFVFDMAATDNRLATAFGEGIRVWDRAAGTMLFDVRPADGGFGVALSPDASLVFVGNKSQTGIYSTASGAPIVIYGVSGSTLALSPNGCRLLAAAADGTALVLRAP